jgi:hypothetical protein
VTVTLSPPVRWDRALAVVLLLMAVALVVWHRVYRTVEMLLAGGLIRLFTSDGVYVAAERQSVYSDWVVPSRSGCGCRRSARPRSCCCRCSSWAR